MSIMKKISFLLFFFLISIITLKAQNERVIPLKEALTLGLKHSPQLLKDTAHLIVATADLQEAREKRLPELSVSSQALWLNQPHVKLPQAGSGANPSIHSAIIANVSGSLPLYAGGRIKMGITQAGHLLEAAKLETQSDSNTVYFTICDQYVQLYKVQQAVSFIQDQLNNSIRRDSVFMGLEQNGIMAKNDRLKAQLQTASLKMSLLEAKEQLQFTQEAMCQQLGLPLQTSIVAENIKAVVFDTILEPYEHYETMAFNNRKELQWLIQQQQAAALGVTMAKSLNMPMIGLSVGYFSAVVPQFITISNAINAGVGIKYNIHNLWKSNTQLQKSRAKELELQATAVQMREKIQLQVSKNFQQVKLVEKKIALLLQVQEEAFENDRIVQQKFDNGLATVTELLDAKGLLIQAELNLVNAQSDLAAAHLQLKFSIGNSNQ